MGEIIARDRYMWLVLVPCQVLMFLTTYMLGAQLIGVLSSMSFLQYTILLLKMGNVSVKGPKIEKI